MDSFGPASGLATTLGDPAAIASTWQPGIGFVALVFVTPVAITIACWIVVKRMTRNLPNQPTSGQRLSSLTSSLNAISRSMGSAGLRESGLRTTATLRSTVDTAAQVNGQPLIDLVLDVDQPDGPPITVSNRSIVPVTALATLTPGARVVVYRDVTEPDQLLVAWEERAEPPRTDPREAGY